MLMAIVVSMGSHLSAKPPSSFQEGSQLVDSQARRPSHWGFDATVQPARIIVMDEWQRRWQKKRASMSVAIEANYAPLPSDSNAFAQDYGYPTFNFGFRMSINRATMHRDPDPAWGMAEEVDYDSRLGNIATLYAAFTRPFFRHDRWSADYTMGTGIGYAHRKYDKHDNIDDELIGSRFLIYFTAGLHANYRFAPHWGVRGGIDFYHHSNGALNRPNKGANVIGPSLGIIHFPNYDQQLHAPRLSTERTAFHPSLYARITLGIGAKTLYEDWQLTQYYTPSTEPSYRTGRFHVYTTYTAQADVMYRYARRWASGIGFDLFRVTYANRVADIDRQYGLLGYKHKPWSAGIAAKHQVFYGNWSVAMSLGCYLYRELGENAKAMERPYYEHIGLHYTFPTLHHLGIGINVKAHATKADYTEFVVSCPIKLTSRRAGK